MKNNIFTAQLIVFLSECCIAAVLLLIAAAVISAQNDPVVLILPASLFVLYFTVILGGIISARLWDSFLWAGLVSGTVLFLLTTVLSLLPQHVPGSGFSAPTAILLRFLLIPVSVLGAWIGRKRTKHSGKHKKRRH